MTEIQVLRLLEGRFFYFIFNFYFIFVFFPLSIFFEPVNWIFCHKY